MSLTQETRTLVDPKTGKAEGRLPILVQERARLRDDWMFLHKKGFLRLAKEGLRGTDFDVLMVYFALLNFNNYVQVSQQEIADELGIAKQSVYRSTKTLIEKKILLEGEKVGRNKTYILNTFFGWKGSIGEQYYETYENHTRMMES